MIVWPLGPHGAHLLPSCVCTSQCTTLCLLFLTLLISRSVFLYTRIPCESHKYLTIHEITACYCYVHKNYSVILQFYNTKIKKMLNKWAIDTCSFRENTVTGKPNGTKSEAEKVWQITVLERCKLSTKLMAG